MVRIRLTAHFTSGETEVRVRIIQPGVSREDAAVRATARLRHHVDALLGLASFEVEELPEKA